MRGRAACHSFRDSEPVQKAWGFTHLYDNVPSNQKAGARRSVHAYLGSGMKVYYQYHHGERQLSPHQQEAIMNILAKFASIDGIDFDHYVTDFDFSTK